MNVAGMNVEQQEKERFFAEGSMENYEMDDKLFTTNVIVEVLIEIVTGFQKNPECKG
uniref:AlNc14C395G11315 protein n=1 Tax=Albugo laibachii Nc14 TaxID=890382 RepID=F0WYQ2_9STRA|nr:AlNc14C395G11315 [Albugo laibachii Nc14]|eukprot:CCA26611.1 AlNc14C395G11315 [Albugo laibachii Nc14]